MSQDITDNPGDRCRLVLCMGPDALAICDVSQLRDVLQAGDLASIIFYPEKMDESAFQKCVEPLVHVSQELGVAAVVADYSRVAGRVSADGLQLGQDVDALRQAIEKFTPGMMIGAGNVKTRHNALTIGDLRPDYVMFGKPGTDTRAEPHPKNIALGEWWSAIVEIPCIVLAGSSLESALDVAKSGAEFVALGNAIFAPDGNANTGSPATDRVRQVNQLLDQHAPRFETTEN
jgi:thiamine-phosphate pyrophosphorylase